MIKKSLQLPCGAMLKNRIVKSAMSEVLADEVNNSSDAQNNLFAHWAESGAAMLLTGNTPVDRWYMEHVRNFVLDELVA